MTVYQLNPLQDPRWAELVQRHPRASVFHSSGWLDALQRTYGYTPVVFTTSAPGAELSNGVVFCEVRSWLTGRRLVSLPFSDHCDPLVEDTDQLATLCRYLEGEREKHGWRYIELRPRLSTPPEYGFSAGEQFCFHLLDIRPDGNMLFRSFHQDSIQRKIRRAERESVAYEAGRSQELLRTFYRLLLLTRRRHQLPPQPLEWFCNLAACLGPAMTIRIASRSGQPIAGIVTLSHRDTMVYKYGASDAAFHRLGGMHLLFWKAIQEARARGCVALDLGRSDLDNEGLLTFKDRWGAARSAVTYWRNPAPDPASSPWRGYVTDRAKRVLRRAPDGFRVAAGRLLYKHVG
ncbi:MAG: GNAT family N-acetyltransferase [Acidobacteria bacterium]|nr:GNAT family N-acetyltransferase [Acidobacteriota bacterium]